MTRRILIAAVGSAAVAAVALTAIWKPAPLLVWNASASVPIGLYSICAIMQPTVGELVLAKPPEPLAALLANGGYLPRGVPLIKHVAALSGSIVCRRKLTVSIDGVERAQAQDRDRAGHLLPSWSGCKTIGGKEVFLLNASEPASLDGRYFGPLPSSSVVGRAVPIWTETQP